MKLKLIPQVNLVIENRPITKKKRKLKGKWTVESNRNLENMCPMYKKLNEEIDKKIMEKLKKKL